MPISCLNELLPFLQKLGRGAKKSLSQNFLIDKNIAYKIVATMKAGERDTVIEIGPGPGVLTEIILSSYKDIPSPYSLVVIEKDDQFAQEISRFQGDSKTKLHVLHKDLFDIDFSVFQKYRASEGAGAFHLISNLPYQITTKALEKIFSSSSLFSSVTLMVQDEVGKKIVQPPGSKNHSFLSIFLAYHTEKMSYVHFVPRTAFFPVPKVDSAIIHMIVRTMPHLSSEKEKEFFHIIGYAFHMKRKTLRHSLQEYGINYNRTMFPSHIRPQELDVHDWLLLFSSIQKK